MSSEYIPLEILTEILRRLPLIALLRFRLVSKTWKRLIGSPFFRSLHMVFNSCPPMIVSYMCDKSIHVEILAEILKRLPLVSLLQFRSVSKSWKRLIDSPYFIVSYGVRHPQLHRFILSYEDWDPHERRYLGFVTFADDDGLSYLPYLHDHEFCIYSWKDRSLPTVPYNHLLLSRDGHPCVVGSSHGLLCLYKRKSRRIPPAFMEMVVLWNPSIRKSVCIQVPNMCDFPNKNYQIDDDAIGFGVCPVTFDPTILKIKRQSETKDISLPWRVRVFTLSTGNWSILSTNLPRESIRLRGCQVVIDRFIYWLAFDMLDAEDGRSQSPFLIMSFDLTAKEFNEINLTGCLTHRRCSIESISKLRESLLLLAYHREFKGDPSVCCLWMMIKEQGLNISFTKLYNINVSHTKVKALLGFRKTGELLLVTKQRDQRVSELEIYHPMREATFNLDTRGEDYSFFMCSYMESLLLLDQLDSFMYAVSN